MTTVGTSQFNLLSIDEIHKFNACLASAPCAKIFGIPPLSTLEAVKFATAGTYQNDSYLMAVYPDRFYSVKSIYDYMTRIREAADKPIYLHAMPMRNGLGGEWNFTSEVVLQLFEKDVICGIKEEHSNLQASYNFIRQLPKEIDVIVAGGSMRRHLYLHSAGANAFLAGVGNFFPEIENNYCTSIDNGLRGEEEIAQESKLFDVFFKYGWHPSLKEGLVCLGLSSYYYRKPWPQLDALAIEEIRKVILEVANGK